VCVPKDNGNGRKGNRGLLGKGVRLNEGFKSRKRPYDKFLGAIPASEKEKRKGSPIRGKAKGPEGSFPLRWGKKAVSFDVPGLSRGKKEERQKKKKRHVREHARKRAFGDRTFVREGDALLHARQENCATFSLQGGRLHHVKKESIPKAKNQ